MSYHNCTIKCENCNNLFKMISGDKEAKYCPNCGHGVSEGVSNERVVLENSLNELKEILTFYSFDVPMVYGDGEETVEKAVLLEEVEYAIRCILHDFNDECEIEEVSYYDAKDERIYEEYVDFYYADPNYDEDSNSYIKLLIEYCYDYSIDLLFDDNDEEVGIRIIKEPLVV